jgi:tRNA A37 threonylcarbamoyladenosine dehydratase
MVVGLGAVGGYALEALARAGVGHLILVDFDRFDESNVNRQILALSSTIGQKKTDVAAARVREINPDCDILIRDICLTRDNIDLLFDRPIDYAVDAIDSIAAKCALIEALYTRQIPFVSSMGAALKTDASCIKAAKLSQTINCPMARKIRNELKKTGVRMNDIDCVFSSEQCILPENAISANPNGGRPILGSLPTITAIFGLTIANTIIQRIARGERV